MLTRTQLQVIARREGVPLHTVERDYVQHLLLRHAARAPLAFKGGTALRIAYGSPRYSEDLDFNADGDAGQALAHLSDASRRLQDYGMPGHVQRRPSREGLAAVLRYEGPLFEGSPRSRGTVRLEVSLRHEPVATEEVFVPRTPYPDVPQLVLRILTRDHLFAEKARALAIRGKPRDLFDLQYLLARGFAASLELLNLKTRLYHRRFTRTSLERGIASARGAWAQDLGPLLGQVPPYAAVADAVRRGFREILPSSR